MNYIDFEAGNKSYKLRLNTRNIVALEKTLGRNPMAIFFEADGNERIPTITEMVAILHCSLQQYNHGISLNDAFDIFDDYVAEGHSTLEFIKVIMEVYQASGLMPKNEEEAKNA
jgi:hypothetical protein